MFSNCEYFVKLAEEKNMSRAAEALCISQPAISKYLKRLEDRLGVELVDHQASPTKLTYMGNIYLRYAIRIMELEKQFQNELSEIRATEQGNFVLGVSQWRGSLIFPKILPLFSKRYPFIDIRIVEGKAAALIDDLYKGRIDLAIMNQYSIEGRHDLTDEKLLEERLLLVANNDHPLVQQTLHSQPLYSQQQYPHFDISKLSDERLVLMEASRNVSKVFFEVLHKRGIRPEKIRYVDHMLTAICQVSVDTCFTIIPESGTQTNYIPDNVTLFTVDEPILSRPLCAIYRDSGITNRAAHTFLTVLREVYAN